MSSTPTTPENLPALLAVLQRSDAWLAEVFASRMPDASWFDHPVCTEPLQSLSDDLGGDLQFIEELLQTYVGASPAPLRDLVHGLQQRDTILARRGAHTLKGSSVNVGAYRVALMSAHLVERIGQERFEECLDLVALLRDEIARVATDVPRAMRGLH